MEFMFVDFFIEVEGCIFEVKSVFFVDDDFDVMLVYYGIVFFIDLVVEFEVILKVVVVIS